MQKSPPSNFPRESLRCNLRIFIAKYDFLVNSASLLNSV